MKYETDLWPMIRAKHFTKIKGKRAVRLIVVHSMEAPESDKTAENVARYFETTVRPASAHVCIDSNSVVQCVLDNDVAFAAPGSNHDGMHLELAGYARQTEAEWLDKYGKALLDNAADVAAQYCLKFGLPVKHLSNDELRRGEKGIVSHAQVTAVYRRSTHTDPGVGFPWQVFIDLVKHFYQERLARVG